LLIVNLVVNSLMRVSWLRMMAVMYVREIKQPPIPLPNPIGTMVLATLTGQLLGSESTRNLE